MQEQPRYVLFLLECQASKVLRQDHACKQQREASGLRSNDLPFPVLLVQKRPEEYGRRRSGLFSFCKDPCQPGNIPAQVLRLCRCDGPLCFQGCEEYEPLLCSEHPWNEEEEFSYPVPLRCRNRKLSGYKVYGL